MQMRIGLGLGARRPGGGGSSPVTSIFGFEYPASEPSSFPGNLIVGTERDATDATKWTRQNNDAALSIAAGNMACNGGNGAARWIGYTDETTATSGDRLAVIANIESASGNVSITSSVGASSNVANARIGWKQGCINANATTTPRVSVTFNAGVSGAFSSMIAYNLMTLAAQKWFIVLTAGQSNGIGATAVADPDIDTPVEGVIVFPGSTNSYVGAQAGVGMMAVDPITHQTLNGSSSDYGGGPSGAFLRELRKHVPEDYTIVFCALSYAGQGFKVGGYWNKDASPRTAYDTFWTIADATWTAAPTGSVIGGLWFCGGEGDLGGTENGASSSGNMGEWVSSTNGAISFFNEVNARSGWTAPKGGGTSWGAVPLIISEIGMDHAQANVINMQNLQKKLVTDSGDGLARPLCAYIERPTGYTLSDGTHYVQADHRIRGQDAARALRNVIYPHLNTDDGIDDSDWIFDSSELV